MSYATEEQKQWIESCNDSSPYLLGALAGAVAGAFLGLFSSVFSYPVIGAMNAVSGAGVRPMDGPQMLIWLCVMMGISSSIGVIVSLLYQRTLLNAWALDACVWYPWNEAGRVMLSQVAMENKPFRTSHVRKAIFAHKELENSQGKALMTSNDLEAQKNSIRTFA